MFQHYIDSHVRQWCWAVFVSFLKCFTLGCFSIEVLVMEEKEQRGHQAGHFETVVHSECVRYEQLILLLLFLAVVFSVVFFVVGLPCACA
jgi:hypothetical protein